MSIQSNEKKNENRIWKLGQKSVPTHGVMTKRWMDMENWIQRIYGGFECTYSIQNPDTIYDVKAISELVSLYPNG